MLNVHVPQPQVIGVPCHSDALLVYDPLSNSAVGVPTNYHAAGPFKWLCAVAFQGRKLTSIQWEFQDPKMEGLYHIRPYWGYIPLHSPYIGTSILGSWISPLIHRHPASKMPPASSGFSFGRSCFGLQVQQELSVLPQGLGLTSLQEGIRFTSPSAISVGDEIFPFLLGDVSSLFPNTKTPPPPSPNSKHSDPLSLGHLPTPVPSVPCFRQAVCHPLPR